jgi:hypothetical protein
MDTLPPYVHSSNSHYIIIPLTRGKFALVDIEDSDFTTYKWHISKVYATRRVGNQVLSMHRIVLERKLQRAIQDNMLADHINGNQLDNRRSNLREVTRTQNAWNSGTQKNNTSQYTGVSFRGGYYVVRLGSNGALLGTFETALDASFCYDKAALERWGEYARLNHPIEEVLAWQAPPHFLHSSNTSGYRGVTKIKKSGKWQASLRHSDKLLHLGTYDTAEDAARAYDRAAIKLKGDKVMLNFPREDYSDDR